VYTARVDEHVHGGVWDVYTAVYMARYGTAVYTAHGRNVTSRPVYTAVYGPSTRPKTAVYTAV